MCVRCSSICTYRRSIFFLIDPEAYLLPTHTTPFPLFRRFFSPSILIPCSPRSVTALHKKKPSPLTYPSSFHSRSSSSTFSLFFLTFIISCYIPTLFVFPSSIPHPPSPPAAIHQHSLSFFHYPNIVLVFYSHPHILLVRFYLPTTFKLICLLPPPIRSHIQKQNLSLPSSHSHALLSPTHNSYSIVIIYLTSLVLSLTHKHSLTSHSNPLFTPFPPISLYHLLCFHKADLGARIIISWLPRLFSILLLRSGFHLRTIFFILHLAVTKQSFHPSRGLHLDLHCHLSTTHWLPSLSRLPRCGRLPTPPSVI